MKEQKPNRDTSTHLSKQQEENWQPTQEELQGIKDALKTVEEGHFYSEEEVKDRYQKGLK